MRTAVGAVIGIVLAFATVYCVEMIGHAVYPLPAGLEMGDYESMRQVMRKLPVAALLFVLAAWTLAALLGGTIAGVVAQRHHLALAAVTGGLILAAAIANMVLLPHPAWFVAAALVLIPCSAWMAVILSKQLSRGRKTE